MRKSTRLLTNKRIKLCILAVSALFLHGCMALTTTQSGRTLGKNNAEIGANLTSGKYDQLNEALPEDNHVPIGEINITFGAGEKLDVGVRASSTTYLSSYTKYQFIGTNESFFAASAGAEIGLLSSAPMFGRIPYFFSAPIFVSVHPAKFLALYTTPRFIFTGDYTFAHETNPARVGEHATFMEFGNSYGLILGNKHKLILEASCYDKRFFSPSQFTIGYKYFIPYNELLPGGKLF